LQKLLFLQLKVTTLCLPFQGKHEFDLKKSILYRNLPEFDTQKDLKEIIKM